MSEDTTKYVICEHDQPASIKGSVARQRLSPVQKFACQHRAHAPLGRDLFCYRQYGVGSWVLLTPLSDATPTLVIVDGSDAASSLAETVTTLKGQYPQARIALIADGSDLSSVKLARSVGVDGFCSSAGGREVLIKSLELVMMGEAVLPTHLMTLLLDMIPVSGELEAQDKAGVGREWSDATLPKLSTREAEILHCLTEGAPNKIIARKLDVAEATVKVHIKAILRKIGAANRTQAAMWATTHLPTGAGAALRS
jgi:two-component system nitrate/nitrite response regulator NarL